MGLPVADSVWAAAQGGTKPARNRDKLHLGPGIDLGLANERSSSDRRVLRPYSLPGPGAGRVAVGSGAPARRAEQLAGTARMRRLGKSYPNYEIFFRGDLTSADGLLRCR